MWYKTSGSWRVQFTGAQSAYPATCLDTLPSLPNTPRGPGAVLTACRLLCLRGVPNPLQSRWLARMANPAACHCPQCVPPACLHVCLPACLQPPVQQASLGSWVLGWAVSSQVPHPLFPSVAVDFSSLLPLPLPLCQSRLGLAHTPRFRTQLFSKGVDCSVIVLFFISPSIPHPPCPPTLILLLSSHRRAPNPTPGRMRQRLQIA